MNVGPPGPIVRSAEKENTSGTPIEVQIHFGAIAIAESGTNESL
jgi:hypothetical protein